MNACRETMDIWFRIRRVIKPYSPYFGRWKCLKDLCKFTKRIFTDKWTRQYFWMDSFGQYLYRWILCPVLGHRDVKWLQDGSCSNEKPQWHCFNCHREVDPGIDKVYLHIK